MSNEPSEEIIQLKQRIKGLELQVSCEQASVHQVSADDEIDLRELLGVLWSGKWIIIAVTALFAVLSVLYALSMPNLYKSTVVLAPVESKSGGLSGLAAQYGGLAAMAGINLGSGGNSQVDEALELVKSWPFLEAFIDENKLKSMVLAVEEWDKQANELFYDLSIYNPESKEWLVDSDEYTSWKAYEAFKKQFSVSKDKQSGLVTISIEYYSPYIAKSWVDMLVMRLNTYYQQKAIKETQKNIDFLSKKASQTSISEMRSMFYSLIEEQTKSLMLASLNEEYLLKTVVPSKPSEVKSSPKRALICVLGTICGFFLGMILVLCRYFLSQKPEVSPSFSS